MLFLCLNNPVVVQLEGRYLLLSNYIQSRIITRLYQSLDRESVSRKECWVLLLLTNLLQLKEFNRMANLDLSKENNNSIRGLLERLLVKHSYNK